MTRSTYAAKDSLLADETKPVYPQRPTSSDDSLLNGLLGLVPGRLLLAVILILCGMIPYFGIALYAVLFVALVALIMCMFHRAYPAPAKNAASTRDHEEAELLDDDADLF